MHSDHVLHHNRHLAELLLADLARERLLLRVRPVVVLEIPELIKHSLAVVHSAPVKPFGPLRGWILYFMDKI